MTRKMLGEDKGFVWNEAAGRIVYAVSYKSNKISKTESVVTVFDNIAEARKFREYCLKRYPLVQMDTCRVYNKYKLNEMKDRFNLNLDVNKLKKE